MSRVRRGNSIFGAICALLVGFLAAPAAAQDQPRVVLQGGEASEAQISADGEVRHRAADFVFPRQLGDMPLRKVIIYGQADLSVDYTLRGGGSGDAWITFFVYPVGQPFANEAADIEKTLIEKWSASQIAAPAAAPTSAADGRSGWFKGTVSGKPATTGYILVQRGVWFLEARYTIPDSAGPNGIERTVKALASAPWAWRPQIRSDPSQTAQSGVVRIQQPT